MAKGYSPPIEIKVGQSRDYQRSVDRMTCKSPGCKRWRVDGATKFCREHDNEEAFTRSLEILKRGRL